MILFRNSGGSRVFARVLMTGVYVAAAWSVAWAESSPSRSYSIVSFQKKTAQADWPLEYDRDRIPRWEAEDGHWAFEYVPLGGKEEGSGIIKFLDSTNAVTWSARLGDRYVVSRAVPMFVNTGIFGQPFRLYNLALSPDPLYEDPSGLGGRVFQSRDGGVFGYSRAEQVRTVSQAGDLLCEMNLPDSFHIHGVALADGGRYLAVGVALDLRIQLLRRGPTKHHPADTFPPRRTAPPPSPSKLVTVFDAEGSRVSEFVTSNEGGAYPRILALSGDDPPLVAVGSDYGPSLWTAQGEMIWKDHETLLENRGRVQMIAMWITEDSRVLGVIKDEPGLAFLAWDSQGALEAYFPLPEEYGTYDRGTRFCCVTDSSVRIEDRHGVVVVGWSEENSSDQTFPEGQSLLHTDNWTTYRNDSLGWELQYPSSFELSVEGAAVRLMHATPLRHADPCDFDDDVAILDSITDFDVSIALHWSSFRDVTESAEVEYLDGDRLKIVPGLVDSIRIGDLSGYVYTQTHEGCGWRTYYFSLAPSVTLTLKRMMVTEFSTTQTTAEECLKSPGIISPTMEELIFEQIIATFRYRGP